MKIKKSVYATCQVEGFHSWPEAPQFTSYLRSVHRHMFHIKLIVGVDGENREIEFISLKNWLTGITNEILNEPSNKSCEMIAKEIIDKVMENLGHNRTYTCEVSEDGENGAVVEVNQ